MSGERILKWPKVVLFGDSLTQRSLDPKQGLWGALLADKLQRLCDVVVRGFSGYNTRMCKSVLPLIYHKSNVDDIEAFVICLGANDASDPTSVSKQHVPLPEYKDNLREMIQHLESVGLSGGKLILMTPPPFAQEKYASFCNEAGLEGATRSRSNELTSQYAAACLEVAQKLNIDCVNIFEEMSKDSNWSRFLVDGLHFSQPGSVEVFALLWPHIARRTQHLTTMFPEWRSLTDK